MHAVFSATLDDPRPQHISRDMLSALTKDAVVESRHHLGSSNSRKLQSAGSVNFEDGYKTHIKAKTRVDNYYSTPTAIGPLNKA